LLNIQWGQKLIDEMQTLVRRDQNGTPCAKKELWKLLIGLNNRFHLVGEH